MKTILGGSGNLAAVLAIMVAATNAGAEPAPPAPRLTPAPQSVQGLNDFRFNLNGEWQFNPAPPVEFWTREPVGWKPIHVPGEWTMQGFTVAPNLAAGYTRTFTAPADWRGCRIKLRCDGIYSEAALWINGREAGKHLGGFTPFELDVTDLLEPGRENRISLAVKNESLADTLASASKYAAHPLGGIVRKMYLLALPPAHVASLQTSTRFDAAYSNATLRAEWQIANEGGAPLTEAEVVFELTGPHKRSVAIARSRVKLPALAPGETLARVVEFPVAAPAQWDTEHPNLYVLHCRLRRGGATVESVERRFGFRQVELRGNQMFINNHPVKLQGVCRHEVHPLLGRSLKAALWRKDAELYAAGNCNYVRTSHYPPDEEFITACDEVGLMVEEEAPFCWAFDNNSREARAYTLQAELEMVQRDRSHPSVIQWSLANESGWNRLFAEANRRVKALDPTRPTSFHDQCWGSANNAGSQADVAVYHYPGLSGPAECDKASRPTLFGEYCHLNAYNRREQIGDPGLRDAWGLGLERMWEAMRAAKGCLGGSLWAAMDDTFFLPDGRTVGYGTWGPLDGWRRAKPEYWHMAKAYSPVRIVDSNLRPSTGERTARLTVENRGYFANLDEFKFAWTFAGKSGNAKTSAAPGQTGVLTIPSTTDMNGKSLEIRVTGPRGFMVDAYRFTMGGESAEIPPPARKAGELTLVEDANTIAVSGDGFRYVFDAAGGQLRQARDDRRELLLAGPCLTLVPLDSEGGGIQMTGREPTFTPWWGLCTGWKASSVKAEKAGQVVTVKVEGSYAEAAGSYEMAMDGAGRLQVTWKFTVNKAINPRQTGVTFVLPGDCQTLSWHRRGQWSWYPADHLGRTDGTTRAFPGHPACGLAGPRTQPTWPWSQDQNEYGCNDFRSTKCNIFSAALSDRNGTGLRAVAAADRHAHAWMDGSHAFLLVANYANDGAEGYFQPTRAIPNRPVAGGGRVSGSALVEMAGARPRRVNHH